MADRRQFLKASAALVIWLTRNQPAAAGEWPANLTTVRTDIASNPQRPRYHFLPPANWMNDPNGPIFCNGYYHLFYQYNPDGAYWGNMHWGHARSRDLVHWTHLPMALAPTPGGPDKGGCFSGSAFDHDGTPTLVYTGVEPEVQCLASSDNAMVRWRKFKGNPVIGGPPHGYAATGFRDPSIWREGADWLMTVGSGVKGRGGAVLLYQSNDLLPWNYIHELASGPPFSATTGVDGDAKYDPVAAGDMWECPDFFPLGAGHTLLVSTQGAVHWMTGSYEGRALNPHHQGKVDYGDFYYAAKSFAAPHGRRILWGWLKEGRSAPEQRAAGWAGVMSLPRVLSMGEDQTLQIEPAPELQVLREPLHRLKNLEVRGYVPLPRVRGGCLEIDAEIVCGSAEEFGLIVRQSPDSEEETIIALNPSRGQLTLDTRRSSLDPGTVRGVYRGPLEIQPGIPVQLSIFLDRSVIEVFANRRACLTARIYPTRSDSLGARLFAKDGKITVKKLSTHTMRSIWG
ncbi:MAG: glycoside hydrolase family 32 protein [Terriglobia bacterium]